METVTSANTAADHIMDNPEKFDPDQYFQVDSELRSMSEYDRRMYGTWVSSDAAVAISKELEAAILAKDSGRIHTACKKARNSNCVFPRAVGLAVHFLTPEQAAEVFWAAGNYILVNRYYSYEEPVLNLLHVYNSRQKNYHCQNLFFLLPIVEDFNHPSLFDSWQDLDLPCIQSISPVSLKAQQNNLELLERISEVQNRYNIYVPYFTELEELYRSAITLGKNKESSWPFYIDRKMAVHQISSLLTDIEWNSTARQFLNFLKECTPDFIDNMMNALLDSTSSQVKKIKFNLTVLQAVEKSLAVIAKIFQNKRTAVSRLAYGKALIDHNQADVLADMVDANIFNTSTTRRKLLEYATQSRQVECQALMMNYINEITDPVAEAEKQMKKEMAELNASPDSMLFLKKIWSWRKNDDNTLTITAYKGPETQTLVIPDHISKYPVSGIGRRAFSPVNRYTDLVWMSTGLNEVVLPDSIKEIHPTAFDFCQGLKFIRLPASLINLDKTTFHSSKNLDLWITNPDMTLNSFKGYFQPGPIQGVSTLHVPKSTPVGRLARASKTMSVERYPRSLTPPKTMEESRQLQKQQTNNSQK